MSLTPYPRKKRHRGSKKVSAHSTTGNNSFSRTASRPPVAPDSKGLTRPHRVDTSAPRTFMQGVSAFVADALWASWSEPTQEAWLSLVKEHKEGGEEDLIQSQCIMRQDTVTTTTSTVYGPIAKMDGSYMVERVVQSESSRQRIVYLASGEGS